MKSKLLAAAIFAAWASSATANAATVALTATAVGNVIDDNGGIADGVFDRTQATAVPEIDATNNFTYRAVIEFDVSPLPIAAVNSAHLHWDLGSATNPPVNVQLYGYAGDGILSVPDAQQSNLIATAVIPQFGDNGVTSFSIDVSTFLASLITANDSFAGFMFRLPVEPPFPNQKMESFMNLALEIDFTPTPLPDTFPLFATGLGALGLLGWRRKRKAVTVA